MARTGEAWTFGIEDGAIKDFLADRGFSLLSHHAPADLEAACLTADDGTRFGRINRTHCIAIAGIYRRRQRGEHGVTLVCTLPPGL